MRTATIGASGLGYHGDSARPISDRAVQIIAQRPSKLNEI